MQVWATAEKAPALHDAVRGDLTNLLQRFLLQNCTAFESFKRVWAEQRASRLHHLCPRAVAPTFFLQIMYQNALDLLHHPPVDISTTPATLLRGLKEVVWNIGIFYTLHVLHYTRLVATSHTKIRLSPQVWTELLVAYERLALFPEHSSQAMRIFRLLISNDIFQFSLCTGAPTLFRVKAILQAADQRTGDIKPDLKACVTTTKELQSNLTTYTKLLLRDVMPVPASLQPISASSPTLPIFGERNSDDAEVMQNDDRGTVDDTSLQEFFNPQHTSSNTIAHHVYQPNVASSLPSSLSIMETLQALESSTQEIFDSSGSRPPPSSGAAPGRSQNSKGSKAAKDKTTKAAGSRKEKNTEKAARVSRPLHSPIDLAPSSSTSVMETLQALESSTQEIFDSSGSRPPPTSGTATGRSQNSKGSKAAKDKTTKAAGSRKEKNTEKAATLHSPIDLAPSSSTSVMETLQALESSTQEIFDSSGSRPPPSSGTVTGRSHNSKGSKATGSRKEKSAELAPNSAVSAMETLQALESSTQAIFDSRGSRPPPSSGTATGRLPNSKGRKAVKEKSREKTAEKIVRASPPNPFPIDLAPSSSTSVMETLLALESSTEEIFNNTSNKNLPLAESEPLIEDVPSKKRKLSKDTSSRELHMKKPGTTKKPRKSTCVTKVKPSRARSDTEPSKSKNEEGQQSNIDANRSDFPESAISSEGGAVCESSDSILDMLSQLERDSEAVLKNST